MKIKYTCKKCGKINIGKWRKSPQRGTYIEVKCQCGEKGIGTWHYNIKGFIKQGEKS